MLVHRMTTSILDCQDRNSAEVGFGKFDLSVEDGYEMLRFQFLRLCIWAMTLEAKCVDIAGAKQFRVVSAMRFVTGRATLFERGLVKMRLFVLFSLIAVATEADIHCVGLREAWRFSGVRVVTVGAITLRARMLNFRGLDVLRLLVVAGNAKSLRILFC
jgi:hypothetical protein